MATSIKRSKGSQSSLRIGTYSYWVKLTTVGGFNVYSNTVENDNNRGYFQFTSDGKWRMVDNDSSGTHIQLRTNRRFRDFNSWYHIVVRVDTTQSTSTDRVRLYVNGSQETSFDQTDYPAQNDDLKIFQGGQTNREYMNNIYGGSASSPNFYLSHFHYADGQSYGPDTFGETDATTGEWNIKTTPTVTYGNQGFFMFKNDASLNDDSGNGNNWSADSGTIQKSEDNPNNVFATFNPLFKSLPTGGLTNGNLGAKTGSGDSTWRSAFANLGASSGKYYMEVKWVSGSHFVSGFASQKTLSNHDFKDLTDSYSGGQYFGIYGTSLYTNGSSGGSYTAAASGNIIQLALDMDNKKIYQGINGTWNVGGNPSSGNGISITGDTDEFWTFGISVYSNSGVGEYQANFGNGHFGSTAVSSAGTNASNNGIFEYDVPTGYTALSTKGLNL